MKCSMLSPMICFCLYLYYFLRLCMCNVAYYWLSNDSAQPVTSNDLDFTSRPIQRSELDYEYFIFVNLGFQFKTTLKAFTQRKRSLRSLLRSE
jgi:hypothetical protein